VSLYLKVGIGAGLYLLDAGRVLEIRSDDARGHWRGEGVPVVDCGDLFDEPAGTRGDGILIGEEDGATAELIVDRVEGLVEIADAELRPVPPIGPLGALIDAVSVLADEPPMLRLRAEHMRATAAALVCVAAR
jgi:chemotaxis signal transduction protein